MTTHYNKRVLVLQKRLLKKIKINQDKAMTLKRNKRKITTKTHYGCLNLDTDDLYDILSIINDYYGNFELKIYNSLKIKHVIYYLIFSEYNPFNISKIQCNQDNAFNFLKNIKTSKFYNKKFNQMELTAKTSYNNIFRISLSIEDSFIECHDFESKGIVFYLEDILKKRGKIFAKTRFKISILIIIMILVVFTASLGSSLYLTTILNTHPNISILFFIIFCILFLTTVYSMFYYKNYYNTIHLNKKTNNYPYSNHLDNIIDLPTVFTIYRDDILDISSLLDENNYSVEIGNYSFTNKDNIQESLKMIADEDGEFQKEIRLNDNRIKIILNSSGNSYVVFSFNDLYGVGIASEIKNIIDKRANKILILLKKNQMICNFIAVTLMTSFTLIFMNIFPPKSDFSLVLYLYILVLFFPLFIVIIYYLLFSLQRNIILYNYNKRFLTKNLLNTLIVGLTVALFTGIIGLTLPIILEFLLSFF